MDATTTVELYVRDVVEQLPRSQRADVALELRGLLLEELGAKASECDQQLNAVATRAFLDNFGHPRDVAARYYIPWAVIAPTDTRSFLTAALVGTLLILGLASSLRASDSGEPLLAILAWLGSCVGYFGIKSWVHGRGLSHRRWVPRDRDRMSMTSGTLLVALIALGIVVYGAPAWVFAMFTGGSVLSDWLSYDATFSSHRLPWLLALWALQAALIGGVTLRGGWNQTLRRLELAMSAAVAATLLWFAWAGKIFAQAAPDSAARTIIGLTVVVILVDIGNKLYRGFGGASPTPQPPHSEPQQSKPVAS